MQSNIESGLQLVARLNNKPSITKELDEVLFFNGLKNNDTVEISGNVSSGKTSLLQQFLAKCLLPERIENVYLNGYNACAILINTDHHFRVTELAQQMFKKIDIAAQTNKSHLNCEIIKTVVTKSLDNLTLINCYNNDQFLITLHTLDSILAKNDKISVLAIDSIMSYYWEDRNNEHIIKAKNLYIKNLLQIIQSFTKPNNIMTFYTKPSSSGEKGITECSSNSAIGNINYKICLYWPESYTSSKNLPQCSIHSGKFFKTLTYTKNLIGLLWSTEGIDK